MATLQQLERALVNADKAGDMDAARRLAVAVKQARSVSANLIPDTVVPGTEPQAPEPGVMDQIIGAGETALALGTGAVGGTIGTIAGAGAGLAQQILSGQFGTPQAVRAVEQAAAKGAQALTYQPRTQAGQEQVQAVGQVLANVLPPVLPAIAAPGAVMQAARTAAPTVGAARQIAGAAGQRAATATGQAIARPVQAATTAVRETFGMETPAPAQAGARVSAGAAATPDVLRRVTTADSLPVPVQLTKGAATRDAQQLYFEKEQIKSDLGGPLRQRAEENNLQALQNFDALAEMTDAQLMDLSSTGGAVVKSLTEGLTAAKNKTRAAYKAAENAAFGVQHLDAVVAGHVETRRRSVA